MSEVIDLNKAYISTHYGLGICVVCEQEAELRMGWCFDCFKEGLGQKETQPNV